MTDGSLAPQNLTQLLVKWRNGDRGALDEMTPVLYEELRKLARHFLASERSDHTLQPTALVHEAYLRLIDQHAVDWRNRLSGIDAQQGRVVELRYFGGLTVEETAEVLGVSPATVKREWSTARLWLLQQMEGEGPRPVQ